MLHRFQENHLPLSSLNKFLLSNKSKQLKLRGIELLDYIPNYAYTANDNSDSLNTHS